MGECLITRRGGEAYALPELGKSFPADAKVVASADGNANFSVQIEKPGRPAEYTYQWYLNGNAISGAKNSGYTRTGLTAAGTYTLYCAVTNKAGTVNSRAATLTVVAAIPAYTYTGSSQVVNDGNGLWRIKFLTSGTLTFTELGNATAGIDVFSVGGGGGSIAGRTGGGGGGRTATALGVSVKANQAYSIIVGAGGNGADGGNTSAFAKSANGGKKGVTVAMTQGTSGGTGGSGGGNASWVPGNGGANGGAGGSGGDGEAGALGQGTTTREFGISTATLYSGGGGGGSDSAGGSSTGGSGGGGNGAAKAAKGGNGAVNTGGGAGGNGSGYAGTSSGGSGIVIIRNARAS